MLYFRRNNLKKYDKSCFKIHRGYEETIVLAISIDREVCECEINIQRLLLKYSTV